MKKIYFAPEMEEVLIKSHALLIETSPTGGGINDDNSATTDPDPSDNPTDDYGW